jgi:hypothetical protein
MTALSRYRRRLRERCQGDGATALAALGERGYNRIS